MLELAPDYFKKKSCLTVNLQKDDAEGEYKPRVLIFSNVTYALNGKIVTRPDDILVFLNYAMSAEFYRNDCVKRKIVYHREPNIKNFGNPVDFCENRYVFGGDIPRRFLMQLKSSYPLSDGERTFKTMTTGYIVAKYMEQTHKDREIILVNFGFEVKTSTYRNPDHNWKFEAQELSKFKKIFTCETN